MIKHSKYQQNKYKLTSNGFTKAEEKRLLHSIKVTQEDIRKGKAEKYTNIDEALAALEK